MSPKLAFKHSFPVQLPCLFFLLSSPQPPFPALTSISLSSVARQPGCFPGERRQCDGFTVPSSPVALAISMHTEDKGKPLQVNLQTSCLKRWWVRVEQGAPITCNSCCLTSTSPVLQTLPGQHQTHLSAGGQQDHVML